MSITGHAIKDMNERYDTVEDWEKAEAITKLETYRNSEIAKTFQSVTKVLPQKSQLSDFSA